MCIPYGLLYSKMPPVYFLFGVEFIFFSSVQLLSCVWLFATPWTAACQASLSFTNSWSLGIFSLELNLFFCLLILFVPNVILLLVICPCFTRMLHITTIATKSCMILLSCISELSPKVPFLYYLQALPMFLILCRIPFSVSNFQRLTPAPILVMPSPISDSFQV